MTHSQETTLLFFILGISSCSEAHKASDSEKYVRQAFDSIRTFSIYKTSFLLYVEIPKQDYELIYRAGAVGIFGPGTKIASAGQEILELLIEGYS